MRYLLFQIDTTRGGKMGANYDCYRIFYYVAKYQSFTKAANILLNGQPNITRSMNNLEHELGCKLFLRTNKGVTLTPEGEKLYSHVAVAYEQIRPIKPSYEQIRPIKPGYEQIRPIGPGYEQIRPIKPA